MLNRSAFVEAWQPDENDLLRADLQANQPWDGLLIKVASHRGADVRLEQPQRFALGEH